MSITQRGKVVLVVLIAALMSACAGVPPEQLAKLASVDAGDSATMWSVDSSLTSMFSNTVTVMPGQHTFKIAMNCNGNNCYYETFRFDAQAGYLYRLMPNRTVEVLDRNDKYNRKVDELTLIGGSDIDYATRQQNRDYNTEAIQLQRAARVAQLARRTQNLPLVKKSGARICQVRGEYLYVGYVEAIADDKVQIRIADAVLNANQNYKNANFKPAIIWDSPLNWDLCE